MVHERPKTPFALAESFLGPDHLELILGEAESIVREALERL